MKLKCIIVDDEPLAIDLLKSYVNQTSFLELVGIYENALSTISVINSEKVQLIFIDIKRC